MYYPKSQIKTNLFTSGGELVNPITQDFYQGYYYETSTGQRYTGKTPQDGPNVILSTFNPNDPIEFKQTFNPDFIITQDDLSDGSYPFNPPVRSLPIFNPTLPTDQDKINGQFNRYFCKKNNEIKYLEINKDTYQQLQNQDPKIAWDLYTPVIILWVIQGNQTQVFNSNKATVQAIEQNAKWYGFSQYFQDKFLKYYLGS